MIELAVEIAQCPDQVEIILDRALVFILKRHLAGSLPDGIEQPVSAKQMSGMVHGAVPSAQRAFEPCGKVGDVGDAAVGINETAESHGRIPPPSFMPRSVSRHGKFRLNGRDGTPMSAI
uniref:hypothetical protein n=1 Tax=Sphingomonas bacterium TaxID=1895847 RepID=UPI00261709A2|nr:hypothetical protein [Sphingomonas bacterium]